MAKKKPTKSIKKVLSKVGEIIYGPRNRRVAVLGAFDTWPYMDFISRRLAEMGYVAITSRYLYKKDPQRKRIVRIDNTPDPDEFMVDFLQRLLLGCARAIIVYSVSGGHFIETDWCYRNHIKTLGIALVRKIGESTTFKQCPDLKVFPKFDYSVCKSSRTAFDCIESGSCPFKEQGISKNVIEYFLRARPSDMVLIAIENIDVIPSLLKKWLRSAL